MKDFNYYLNAYNESGKVTITNAPLVFVDGLEKVRLQEVILFETGDTGWVVGLNKDSVEIFLFSKNRLPVGTRVTRTKQTLSIPVGDFLLGKTIPACCLDFSEEKTGISLRPIDIVPKGIMQRTQINKPLKTGITLIDLLIPLGRGQRELIIGDRKIGKTKFVLTAIKQQIADGLIPIYTLIGKRQSDIKAVEEILEEEGIRDKCIIVAASSHDAPSRIYLAPFTAMTIAEYFADQGKDTVVILDDLYVHAKFYRELSLIANKFPGRDSYPGDIFYTHARLLERAGNFVHPTKGEVSISCLPVVETIQGNMTGYIQTNLMGITDGHVLFDNDLFYNGQRPAVNIHLSVTRAGRQTQSPLLRDINSTLNKFLSVYEQMKQIAHFGTEIALEGQSVLQKGDLLLSFFNQEEMIVKENEIEVVLFALIWTNTITTEEQIEESRKHITHALSNKTSRTVCEELLSVESLREITNLILSRKEQLSFLWQTHH